MPSQSELSKEVINLDRITNFRFYDNVKTDSYPAHWHMGVEIIMPIENTYEVLVENELIFLKEQEILFINSGVLHSMNASTGGRRYILQFDLPQIYQLNGLESSLLLLPPVFKLTTSNKSHGHISTLIQSIIDEYNKKNILFEVSIYSYLLQFYITISREKIYDLQINNASLKKRHEYTEKLLDACDYIIEHYNEDISCEYMADMCGFSKFHFLRLFKQFTGVTFYNYLIECRLNKAELLLINSDMNILDISLAVGFNSISSFNRIYKSKRGITPNIYRKQRKDNFLICE